MKFLTVLVAGVILGSIAIAPFVFLWGWLLMVAIGIIHSSVLPAVHPVGYWISTALAALLATVFRGEARNTTSE